MVPNIIQALLVLTAATSLTLLGRRRKVGWLFALAGEALWVAYALLIGSWGLICLAALYGTMHIHNYLKWGKQNASAAEDALEAFEEAYSQGYYDGRVDAEAEYEDRVPSYVH